LSFLLRPEAGGDEERMDKLQEIGNILRIAIGGCMLAALFGCSMAVSVNPGPVFSPQGTTTTIIMIRHGERANKPGESALTPPGRQRAQDLVAAIGDMEITAIYSPDRGRNRETVQPLAAHLGMPVNIIAEERLTNTRRFADEFVEEILTKHAGGTVVWVGNKSPVGIWGGNLKEIYRRLDGTGNPPEKYDDLFIIEVPDHGAVRVQKTTYGRSAGRFDQ
jgi:hypothetical protein